MLPHLDAAVLTQGDSTFSVIAKTGLAGQAELPTFDALVEAAPQLLRDAWHADEDRWVSHEGTLFLVGYSHAEDEFRAYIYANDQNDFECRPTVAPHIMPAPFAVTPSDLELVRLAAALSDQVDEAYMRALTEDWPARAPFAAPETKSDWVLLAKQIREQRALDEGRTKTLIGGSMFHTKLARGKASTHEIHKFDDTGDELELLVYGSLNAASQTAPCPCKSGKAYRECYLPNVFSDDRYCGSGKPIGEYCAIVPPQMSAV